MFKRKLTRFGVPFFAFITGAFIGSSAFFAVEAVSGSKKPLVPKKNALVPKLEQNIEAAEVSIPVNGTIFVGPSDEDISAGNGQTDEIWDAGGYYSLGRDGLPKEFEDMEYVEIITHDYSVEAEDGVSYPSIPPKGWMTGKKEFKFERIALGKRDIAFTTATVNGVSYRFTGKLLSGGYCGAEEDMPDIKGRLIKIKNGKWAAETEAKFYASCGC